MFIIPIIYNNAVKALFSDKEYLGYNISFITRFGAASVSKAYYMLVIWRKNCSSSFPFSSPLWVVVGFKE